MAGIELDDLIVLLLGASSGNRALRNRIEGVTRLGKLVFLVERETRLPGVVAESADFQPCGYGPFSGKVYKSVACLGGYGLLEDTGTIACTSEDSWERVSVIGDEVADPYTTRDLALTEKGLRYYEILVGGLGDGASCLEELSDLKETFRLLPLRQLVRYVHNQYPDMTVNVPIRDQITADERTAP